MTESEAIKIAINMLLDKYHEMRSDWSVFATEQDRDELMKIDLATDKLEAIHVKYIGEFDYD